MEQTYSHQHITQAHHNGLIIGTLIGSLVVTAFAAIAVVIVNPRLLLHPLDINSEVTVQTRQNQTPDLGPAATATNQQLSQTQSSYGTAAHSAGQISH